jgi:hypothetical protein
MSDQLQEEREHYAEGDERETRLQGSCDGQGLFDTFSCIYGPLMLTIW